MILLYWRLFKTKVLGFCVPSFCKNCGIEVRDFSVTDDIWKRIQPHIKYGNTLCYNCFSDACVKAGLPANWRLEYLDQK